MTGSDGPATAFAALSDPTRVAILQALWDEMEEEPTFSELRSAVGVRDSGQFNYHLGELRGTFVTKTDEGYRLSLAGLHVVGSLYAGAFDDDVRHENLPMDEPCPRCGGATKFSYDGEGLQVDCESCEDLTLLRLPAPPGVIEPYDEDEVPAAALRYGRRILGQVRAGFCPLCEGPIAESLTSEEHPAYGEIPRADYNCERCDQSIQGDLWTAVLDHPEVVTFYHDNGVDVREESLLRITATEEDVEVVDAEPFRARVAHETGGEELVVTVDADLTVVDTERRED